MIAGAPRPPEPIPGARLLFSLDPAVAHLNHGSFGSVPIGVQRAQQRLRDETEANPMRFFTQGLDERIGHTRRHLAGFLGADPDGAALVDNATTGVTIVLRSLGLRPGDEVVGTDHGYGSVALAAAHECRRSGATVRTIGVPLGAPDDRLVQIIRDGLRPGRTKLLIVDQITSPTARLLPTPAIVTAARNLGVPVLVDAAHAPGMLATPVADVGADFWVGNLHKWGYAPRGTAMLVVAPRWRDRIEPPIVSWEQETGYPQRIESQATRDYTGWLAAPVGVFTLRALGLDRVREHNAALAAYGQWVVGAALGVAPADLPDPGGPVSMRIIPLPARLVGTLPEANDLRLRIAAELATEVAVNAWDGRGWLRLCGQVYNHPDEYDRLAERLPALLADASRRSLAA